MMKVIPSGKTLGAAVEGLDLATPLSDTAFERVQRALGEYSVLRFPKQQLTAQQLVDFSARFGKLEINVEVARNLVNGAEGKLKAGVVKQIEETLQRITALLKGCIIRRGQGRLCEAARTARQLKKCERGTNGRSCRGHMFAVLREENFGLLRAYAEFKNVGAIEDLG